VADTVDWQAASRGPRSVDVFHCRGNITDRFGLDVPDRFIDIWQTVSGSTYDPWAEVVRNLSISTRKIAVGPRGQSERTSSSRGRLIRFRRCGFTD
jgi:hypothetical protein